MAVDTNIVTALHGRRVGLNRYGELVVDGKIVTRYSADSSGNITGLVGANDAVLPINPAPGTVVVFGDSLTSECNVLGTPTAATRSGNVVTMTLASHGFGTGSFVRIYGMTNNTDYNTSGQVAVTRVDANNFSYASTGADGTATIDSTYARVMYEGYWGNSGYWVFANGLMNGALRLVENLGQSSETTAMMVARLSAVVNFPSQEIWVLAGANDVVGSTTVATTIANLKAMYQAFRGQGRIVRALTIFPLGSGHAQFATATPKIQQINEWIRQYCRKTNGMILVDTYAALVDPASATGAPLANALRADNVHLQTYGAYLVGQAVKNSFNGQLPNPAGILTSCQVDNYAANASNPNIWVGAPWVNSGGSISDVVSGTAGTGFNVASSGNAGRVAVASVPARSDGYGYDQQVVFISAAAADSVTIQQQNSATLPGRVVAGEQYLLRFAWAISNVSGSGLSYIRCQIQCTVDGVTVALGSGMHPVAFGANNVNTDMSIVVETPPLVIPPFSSMTSFTVAWIGVFASSGTAITIKVGRVSLVRVNNS